jgi:Domain of unknown function (DUF1918)
MMKASDLDRSNPRTETAMRATVGDRIVLVSRHENGQDRDGEILEVRGADGGSPYVVRWFDSGNEVLLFPGAEVQIDLRPHDPLPADPSLEP